MTTPLHRLYKTKLALMAVLFVAGGVLLLVVGQVVANSPEWSWLSSPVAVELGSALFITGLLVVAFEYVDREDAEARAMERLREVMREQAPVLRDTVIQGFAVEPETLAKVASPATLDQVVRNSLGVQLGDTELAHDVYADLQGQVLRSAERWRDVQVAVTLSPWNGGPESGVGSMFEATVRWEYRTRLAHAVQRFSCVSDLDEYRELLHDPTSTLVWYFEPVGALTAVQPEVFELMQFTIDGKARPLRRGKRAKSQTFVVEAMPGAENDDQREVVVAYTYRVLVQRHSHMLQLDFVRPAKGIRVQFGYGGCGIRHVNVLDFFAGAMQPRIMRAAAGSPQQTIEIGFDGWVWPKSGVAVVWVLGEEIREHKA